MLEKAKLHEIAERVMAGLSATWHFRSAEWHLAMPWHLCHGGPTPHAFPMCVSHFRVF